MENPKPGTPEYRRIVRKKLIVIVLTSVLGILGIISAAALIYFDIPQSKPAIFLTVILFLCSAGVSTVTLLTAISLRLNYAQTRITQLQDNQPSKNS